MNRRQRRVARLEYRELQARAREWHRTCSHDEAVGPFSVSRLTPRYSSINDALVGTCEAPTGHKGLRTYGWARMVVRQLYRGVDFTCDEVRYIIRDARGRQVYESSLHDLRGRRLPPRPMRELDPDELPF